MQMLQSSPVLYSVVEGTSQEDVAIDHLGEMSASTHKRGSALVHGFLLGFSILVTVYSHKGVVVVWPRDVKASDLDESVSVHVAVVMVAKISLRILLQFIVIQPSCFGLCHFLKRIVAGWDQHERKRILCILALVPIHRHLLKTLTKTNIRQNKKNARGIFYRLFVFAFDRSIQRNNDPDNLVTAMLLSPYNTCQYRVQSFVRREK